MTSEIPKQNRELLPERAIRDKIESASTVLLVIVRSPNNKVQRKKDEEEPEQRGEPASRRDNSFRTHSRMLPSHRENAALVRLDVRSCLLFAAE